MDHSESIVNSVEFEAKKPTVFTSIDLCDITNLPKKEDIISIVIWVNDIKRDNEFRISFSNTGYKATESDIIFQCAYRGIKRLLAKTLYAKLTSEPISYESFKLIGEELYLSNNLIQHIIYDEFHQTQIQITTESEDYIKVITIKLP